jgi:glycosyltransferase involved in cell wall biosynthesis
MTRKLKIAVSAISKNESQFVKRFCDSAKDADLILIADTGSSDDTIQQAMNCGALVYDICISPWRFDLARNAAIALLPRDIDIVISLDLDEVLEPNWRKEIERVWIDGTTRLRYKFDWGCGISFYYEKIFSRHGYRFHHAVHEYPRPDGRIQEIYAHTDMLLVRHLPDNTKSRGQYMPLLELAVKEDPFCPRNAFYFARELTFYSRWEEAIVALHKYLAMPEAVWNTERSYAMRLLGKSYENLKNNHDAFKWYQMATIECPTSREPWVDLSVFAYMQMDWELSYYTAKKALSIKNKALVYTMDPSAWEEKPYMYASIAAWHLGKLEEARQLNEEALKFSPENSLLLSNREAMKNADNQ